MDKRIKKIAKRFSKKIGYKPKIATIVKALRKEGYTVIFFNTAEGDEVIKGCGLQNEAAKLDAFTIAGELHFVFINDKMSINHKIMALLHEAGHIMLEHLNDNEPLNWQDNKYIDTEAEAFVLEILTPHTCHILPVAFSSIVVMLAVLFGTYCYKYAFQTAISSNAVYITRTGEKFHTLNCISTKDKNCAMIDRGQAIKIFEACSVCNP